jgi:putative MATE family efflux protein
VRLGLPIMGANILQMAYQLIDAFWVGRLGAAAVAAVSISMPIMFLIVSAGMGFAIAGTTLIAQYAGARNPAMVDHVAAQTLLTTVAVSAILGAFGFLLTPGLLDLMGVAPDVHANARVFLRVTFVSLPFAFAYFMFQALMRGVGQATVPLYIVAGTVVVNFVLDPILIFGMFGAPKLGVLGAALATMTAQVLAAVAGLYLLGSGRYGIRIVWREFRPDFAFIKRAFLLGYPASIEQSARGLGLTLMTFLIASFGTVTTAAYGIGTNVLNFVVVPAMGISMATSTLVGHNIGANQLARAEAVVRTAAGLSFWALSGVGLLCLLFAHHIAAFFVPGNEPVIAEASVFIRTVSWSFGFIGLQFALMGVLRASGNMMAAMVISLVSQWVLQFPLAYVLSKHAIGAHGLWWAFPAANVGTALISAVWFARGDWKERRLVEQTPAKVEKQDVADQVVIS